MAWEQTVPSRSVEELVTMARHSLFRLSDADPIGRRVNGADLLLFLLSLPREV
jgi:hypothetical protein